MKVTLPEHTGDITLGQFQAFLALDKPTAKDKLHIFLDLPVVQVEGMQLDDINRIVGIIDKALSTDFQFSNKFSIDGIEFEMLKDLDEITIAEFGDMSFYGIKKDTLHNLMAILFRPIKNKKEYGGTSEFAELMRKTPMNIVTGASFLFLDFVQRIAESYPEVFSGGTEEGESSVDYFKDFGWYPTFKKLAKNNILNLKKVQKLPLHECLMFLACDAVEQKVKADYMNKRDNTILL